MNSIILPSTTRSSEPDDFPESSGPCEDCAHSLFRSEKRSDSGSCMSGLPTVQIFAIGVDNFNRPVTQEVSAWPPVRRRHGCSSFLAKQGKRQ